MNELEPTWSRTLAIWWLMMWRGVLGGLLLGGVAGFVVGFICGLARVPEETTGLVTSIQGAFIGLAWTVVVARMALRKRYGEFRLALIPTGGRDRAA